MDEEFPSKDFENEELILNTDDSDYKKLITRLKEIKTKIALLEKKIFN